MKNKVLWLKIWPLYEISTFSILTWMLKLHFCRSPLQQRSIMLWCFKNYDYRIQIKYTEEKNSLKDKRENDFMRAF